MMSMSRSVIWSRLGLRVGAHREAGRHPKRFVTWTLGSSLMLL